MRQFTSWPLATLIILLLQTPTAVTSICSVSYSGGCGSGYSATSTITFNLIDDTSGSNVSPTYNATTIFHWGPTDTNLGSRTYTTGSEITKVENYNYDGEGEYYAGYTIEFGEGSGNGCVGTRYTGYFLVSFDDDTRTCDFEEIEGSSVPTRMVTDSPTTSPPTKKPTPTPSKKPTFALEVTTPPPTKTTTKNPTSMLEPPELIIPTCGNYFCSLLEYDTVCSSDCTNIVLEADLDDNNEGSNDNGGGNTINRSDDVQGTMFSILAQRDVILTSLNIFSNEIDADRDEFDLDRVEVYTKVGSYDGYETDDTAWTKVYDNYNNLLGPSQSTRLNNLNNGEGVSIVANSIVSFYVYAMSGVQCYIVENNDTLGDNYPLVVSDNVLDVYQGIEQSAKWTGNGNTGADMAFRGAFRYDVVKPSTVSPTIAPTIDTVEDVGSKQTLSPTNYNIRPVPTTMSPTITPTTNAPTNQPTTNAPTIQGTSTVSGISRTMAPVSTPNDRPNPSVTTSPNSSDTTTTTTTGSPTEDEAETTPLQQYVVSSKMDLNPSDLLDEVSETIWKRVTWKTIRKQAAAMVGIDRKSVDVDIEIVDQTTVLEARRTLRKLQTPSSPLEIDFIATIQFRSDNKDDWDGNKMVASAFDTADMQSKYIGDLKDEDDSYFQSLNSMVLKVDDKVVTLPKVDSGVAPPTTPTTPTPPPTPTPTGGNPLYIIIAAVAGGALLFVGAIGIYYTRRKKRRKRQEETRSFATMPEEQTRTEVAGLEIESASDAVSNNQLDELCLGVIESKEGAMDDISAMEEPWFPDAPHDTGMDKTVGESVGSSQQQKFVYGIGCQMEDSTIVTSANTKTMFNDDATFENLYGHNPGISNDGGGSSFQRFTVVAPSGLLGIVLDNPNFDLPVVHAIRETSALHGKVRVGDLLLSVDEVDCRGMSTSNISTFLSSRSKNPTRTLELVRGSGMDGNLTVDI